MRTRAFAILALLVWGAIPFKAQGFFPHEEDFKVALPKAFEFYNEFQKSLSSKRRMTPARAKKLEGLARVYQERFIIPFAAKYSWAIPTPEAIREISYFAPIVEMGAGNGYWAYLLRKEKVQIAAFDNFSLIINEENDLPKPWTQVLQGDEKTILDHLDKTLLLCWPEDENPMAANVLDLYTGPHLIYIGEGRGGVTADDSFFDRLDRDFILVKFVNIPNWPGRSDSLNIYKRKCKSTPEATHCSIH